MVRFKKEMESDADLDRKRQKESYQVKFENELNSHNNIKSPRYSSSATNNENISKKNVSFNNDPNNSISRFLGDSLDKHIYSNEKYTVRVGLSKS